MITARLESEDDFDGWRAQCRGLLRLGAKPADVVWQVGAQRTDLFANPDSAIEAAPIGVPKGFAELSRSVICHNDPERFGLLFQLLIDLKAGRRHMGDRADPLLRNISKSKTAFRVPVRDFAAIMSAMPSPATKSAKFILPGTKLARSTPSQPANAALM